MPRSKAQFRSRVNSYFHNRRKPYYTRRIFIVESAALEQRIDPESRSNPQHRHISTETREQPQPFNPSQPAATGTVGQLWGITGNPGNALQPLGALPSHCRLYLPIASDICNRSPTNSHICYNDIW